MPQIRCPNCGTTVNLEIRREMDFNLILKSIGNKERSFSELLRITKLPRKTLDFRLKQLLKENKVAKNRMGLYCISNNGGNGGGILDREIHLNRKMLSLLLVLLLFLPTSMAFAMLIQQKTPKLEPLGSLIVKISVKDVYDVYGWQIGVHFDPTKLKVIDFRPGDFFGEQTTDDTLSENAKDLGNTLFFSQMYPDGTLVLCQTLKGENPPKSGNGMLAVVEFQYYSQDFDVPYLIFNDPARGTMLLRKDATEIPISKDCITFEIEFLS
ncbi:MAG: cohesin domain-containing protein [Candidatus Bathyarchaeia archaeon]